MLGPGRAKLFATMRSGAQSGLFDVEIDGLTERPKSRLKKARTTRRKRRASCELRFYRVTLPATEKAPNAAPITGVRCAYRRVPHRRTTRIRCSGTC